jgi:hypothetical protein
MKGDFWIEGMRRTETPGGRRFRVGWIPAIPTCGDDDWDAVGFVHILNGI